MVLEVYKWNREQQSHQNASITIDEQPEVEIDEELTRRTLMHFIPINILI